MTVLPVRKLFVISQVSRLAYEITMDFNYSRISIGISYKFTNIQLYVDIVGDGYLTDEDRKIDFDKSKMFTVLERRNHAKILTISLLTPGILISFTHLFCTICYVFSLFSSI